MQGRRDRAHDGRRLSFTGLNPIGVLVRKAGTAIQIPIQIPFPRPEEVDVTPVPKHALLAGALFATAAAGPQALASSHREAPFITQLPKVDGTDFYMFRSYESGRQGYVTLIANYLPKQDAYGGPNYFSLDDKALYEIHVDNNGDAREDITFQFRFTNTLKDIALPISGQNVSIPLTQAGVLSGVNPALLNVRETYTVDIVRGDRRGGQRGSITNAAGGGATFDKPVDNIGDKTFGGAGNYSSYANAHIHNVNIPGCAGGRVFVGQRKEGFAVALGRTFDLINLNPLGPANGNRNTLEEKNVTSLALEVPISCLTAGNEPVIGAWTTASKRQGQILDPTPAQGLARTAVQGGPWVQVSRVGMPLVNEVVIGLKDKDRFNSSKPKDDGQFAAYVTNPTLPALIQTLFPSAPAPTKFPRQDLVVAFLTGVPGLNKPATVTASEMLRLNTSIAAVAANAQNPLGVLGNDTAGFPNGRRPGDDVVDIELRVAMGVLCTLNNPSAFGCVATDAPAGAAPITDGAFVNAGVFYTTFPYLTTPLPGSPD